MPCLAMHLAVAKEYLKRHPEENKEEFILGTIAPDINIENINKHINGVEGDKNSHHFGENYNTSDAIEYMKRKINFQKFFNSNDLSTSFLRAYFLHLICDYKFFGEYITKDDIKGITIDEIKEKGYADYNRITPKIIEKYDLEIPEKIKDIISGISDGKLEILNEQKVYEFIEDMSKIDIENYKNEEEYFKGE